MYGMVNKGLQAYVIAAYGEERWAALRLAGGAEPSAFVSMKPYADSVTYGLVGAVPEVLGVSAGAFLLELGRFWIGFVRERGYEDLLYLTGGDLLSALEGMDGLHARIQATFPELVPPSLRLERSAPPRLHYRSERPGLTPFVEGLVLGLADFYEESCSVRVLPEASEGPGHVVFELEPR